MHNTTIATIKVWNILVIARGFLVPFPHQLTALDDYCSAFCSQQMRFIFPRRRIIL